MAKYERIAADLRGKIGAGEYPDGKLPAETELTAEYRVSLTTVRQALGVLRGDGLIESRHGTGTFVRTPPRRITRTQERHRSDKRRALLPESERRSRGAVEDDTGLAADEIEHNAELDTVPASDDLAKTFGVQPGTPLLCRTYTARSKNEGRLMHLIHSYLVHEVAARNPELLAESGDNPWPGGTHHQVSTIGLEIGAITEHVTTRTATAAEAELLGLAPGTALMCIRKISTSTTGGVVEVSDILLPGDRTELVYVTELEPWP
jgi:GntR family transcriptional regulator